MKKSPKVRFRLCQYLLHQISKFPKKSIDSEFLRAALEDPNSEVRKEARKVYLEYQQSFLTEAKNLSMIFPGCVSKAIELDFKKQRAERGGGISEGNENEAYTGSDLRSSAFSD